MRTTLVAGAIAVVAVFAGVVYFARDRAPTPAEAAPAEAAPGAIDGGVGRVEERAPPGKPAAQPATVARSANATRPAVTDPRLAALMVSPDNGLIEFFADADGRVIKEVDNDPNSAGYGKPLREYTYAGDKVIRLVAYKYLGSQIQIVNADVVYKPDGSVDEYQESTRYEPAR